MNSQSFTATYLIETPVDPAKVAEVMAGEQSCGTFTRVQGETDELRARLMEFGKDLVVQRHLVAADGAPVRGVERQDQGPAAQFFQRNRLVRGSRQGERRGGRAGWQDGRGVVV